MLILTRHAGQVIRIGDDISIQILENSHNGQIRLGIDAPKHIAVHREEVYQRIFAEKTAATALTHNQ